jgi:ribosome biogenesis protein Tsr3
VVEHLPSKLNSLSSNPSSTKIKMHIKMRCHCTSTRISKIKCLKISTADENVEQLVFPDTADKNISKFSHFGK